MSIARLLVGGGVLVAASSAHGALIEDFNLLDSPDIASGFLTTEYNESTNAFSSTGFALSYDDGIGAAEGIAGGSFTLNAVIDETGDASSGSLSIGGTVDVFGPSLLDGVLVDFGFIDAGGMILEFLFSVTGGDLADEYGGINAEFGVILDTRDLGYSGDWTKDFLLNGGVADTAAIPAPAGLALLGLAGLCGRRRRRD